MICTVAVLLCSCTGTSLKTTWRTPEHRDGKVRSVGALAMDERGLLRKGFENRFVTQLSKRGCTAMTTYDLLSLSDIKKDKPAAGARLQTAGADSLLILRLRGVGNSYREIRPGQERFADVITGVGYTGWYDYYEVAFADMSPTYGSLIQTVMLESSLFDLKTGKCLWSAVTQTVLTENMDRLPQMDAVVAKVVAAMHKDGMI
jgi:hypothetical protein